MLERDGWVLVTTVGSHRQFKHLSKPGRVTVSGGLGDIGRAIALELARRGADVAINYNSASAAADEVVAAIREMGRVSIAIQADVASYASAGELVKQATEALGGLNCVVNNAGITRDKLLMAMKEEDWQAVIQTNLSGVYNVTQQAIRQLLRNRDTGARVVNITSVSGIVGVPGQANYSAAKAGIIGFTKAVAKEVATRLMVERLWMVELLVGALIVIVGGVPTTAATLMLTGTEVALRELVSVTRVVST